MGGVLDRCVCVRDQALFKATQCEVRYAGGDGHTARSLQTSERSGVSSGVRQRDEEMILLLAENAQRDEELISRSRFDFALPARPRLLCICLHIPFALTR